MVARLVRDQEVVGSSPVTSTTKKRRVFALRFFVFADANPRPLPFYRAPGNRSKAIFSGRGGAERARGRRPAGAARESSRPRRRGFKSRHLDHKKAKGFCPSLFCFCGREPTTSLSYRDLNNMSKKLPFTSATIAFICFSNVPCCKYTKKTDSNCFICKTDFMNIRRTAIRTAERGRLS